MHVDIFGNIISGNVVVCFSEKQIVAYVIKISYEFMHFKFHSCLNRKKLLLAPQNSTSLYIPFSNKNEI
jgi:hypothetical protein